MMASGRRSPTRARRPPSVEPRTGDAPETCFCGTGCSSFLGHLAPIHKTALNYSVESPRRSIRLRAPCFLGHNPAGGVPNRLTGAPPPVQTLPTIEHFASEVAREEHEIEHLRDREIQESKESCAATGLRANR